MEPFDGIIIPLASTLFLGALILFRITSCPHFWDLVDKTELPPPIIVYRQQGGSLLHSWYLTADQAEEMCKQTVVLALRCKKCGKSKIEKIRG